MPPIVHHPAYGVAVGPAAHRFPSGKFARLAELLVEDGLVGWDSYARPEPASCDQLRLAHDPAYVDSVLAADVEPRLSRRIGFDITPAVALRARCAVGGTLLAARLALVHGVACNTAGGSHHADYAGGAGFCVFNDVGVATRVLREEGAVGRVLVIDLDVHQGDGTARVFAQDPSVFTYSVHCEKNWPSRKAVGDLDRALPKGVEDAAYLTVIERDVPMLLATVEPDLVFYNAGVDPHREDRLGLLALTDTGLAQRDALVLSACRQAGVPVAGVLGGGYAEDLTVLARRHALLHHAAADVMATRAMRGQPR